MKRCREENTKTPQVLQNLLSQRRLPLSEDGLDKVLHELGTNLTVYQAYLVSLEPDEKYRDSDELDGTEIVSLTLLNGEEEKYLPVFTSLDKLKAFRYPFGAREQVYYCDVLDLLHLVNGSSADAAVLNPGEDDLILSVPMLENMLRQDPKTKS